MQLTRFLMMFACGGFVTLATYLCLNLLKSAQCREDTDDERLWHYLLNPGRF